MIPKPPWNPRFCVWEITLACNMKCVHCGSFAGRPREDELDTKEALGVVASLAAIGCRSITLSGGEPLLRDDWPVLVKAIHSAGMRPELVTNGIAVSSQADDIAKAGFFAVSFSIDGPSDIHDELRVSPGATELLLKGAGELKSRGVRLGAVTQVNRRNLDRLEETYDLLLEHEFEGWQVQLTLPYGRAADADESFCLSPEELPVLEKKILEMTTRGPLFIQAADTIGYMSRGEPKLRAGYPGRAQIWAGCQAGLQVIGITSDGTIRGCLSMPPHFDEDNVRVRPLEEIWNTPNAFAYNRKFSVDDLDGNCAPCAFHRVCRGGCTSLAYTITGKIGHNPYCLRRIAEQGEESE
ncbi:MAG: radical SAM protein [Deltaproteobacteria bacterium]|nr:radical SAM protein [Deltaproteobacteria bacterium]